MHAFPFTPVTCVSTSSINRRGTVQLEQGVVWFPRVGNSCQPVTCDCSVGWLVGV